MTTCIRLESPNSDPKIGGCLVSFTPTLQKVVSWQSGAPIHPAMEAAKNYTVALIEELQKIASSEAQAAIRETNWVSVTAMVRDTICDWNDALIASIWAEQDAAQAQDTSI
jgi:hypothetical protein